MLAAFYLLGTLSKLRRLEVVLFLLSFPYSMMSVMNLGRHCLQVTTEFSTSPATIQAIHAGTMNCRTPVSELSIASLFSAKSTSSCHVSSKFKGLSI